MAQRDDFLKRARQLAGIEQGLQAWKLGEDNGEVGGADLNVAENAVGKIAAQLRVVAKHVQDLRTTLDALTHDTMEAERLIPAGSDISPLRRRVEEMSAAAHEISNDATQIAISVEHMSNVNDEAIRMIRRDRANGIK